MIEFERSYGLGAITSSRDLPNAGQNKGFYLETNRGHYFLREYRKGIASRTVSNEAVLIEFLYQNGLPVPKIIRNKHGELLSRTPDGEAFFVQEFIEGDFFPTEGLDVNERQMVSAAQTLARFHKVMQEKKPQLDTPADIQDYTTESFFSSQKALSIWKDSLSLINQKTEIDTIDMQILGIAPQKIKDILALDVNHLNSTMSKMPSLLAHGDFTPQNLIFKDDEVVAIVDWELARYQPRVWELLRAVCSFCKTERTEIFNTPLDIIKAKNFITAYEEINPLTKEEKEMMFYLAYVASLFPYYFLSSRYIHNSNRADRFVPTDWTWWKDHYSEVTEAVFAK